MRSVISTGVRGGGAASVGSAARGASAARAAMPVVAVSLLASSARGDDPSGAPDVRLVTDRAEERTGFQESTPRRPLFDLRTDFVMVYGAGGDLPDRVRDWRDAGYVPHIMTGISWGEYQDYLGGEFDGAEHGDEGQVDGAGRPILHGPTVPYMVPTIAFTRYLEARLAPALAAGAVALHLEEPEFWARAGFGPAFQREWRIHYREPWTRPDASCDAQYRASELKYLLYQRALDRVGTALKERALVEHDRLLRLYVPTHSLTNYTSWRIVSPQTGLVDLAAVDGYVAQVWTGTARTPNHYAGKVAERTFETALLEYGDMAELVRGTGRDVWFLHDPIEDDPRHDWDDYRRNWIATVCASLLHADVWRYEVSPWPRRVLEDRYPRGRADARRIPPEYATTLAVIFQQLRDLEPARGDDVWEASGTRGVGVLLSDSAMFQRAEPAFSTGLAESPEDVTRATRDETVRLAGFFGLALPPLARGMPVRPVRLDNVARFPGYLDPWRVLLLSYEFQKPRRPGVHLALAEWVRAGGALVYAGAGTDPFHDVRAWWREGRGRTYEDPSRHLFEVMGLGREPEAGTHRVGEGAVVISRRHPASFSRSEESAEELRALVREAAGAIGVEYRESDAMVMRRGANVIAARLGETGDEEPHEIEGRFIDLLDPALPIVEDVRVAPGEQVWLLDLDRVLEGSERPTPLASGARIESWRASDARVDLRVTSMEGVGAVMRLALPSAPVEVTLAGEVVEDVAWDEGSRTALLRFRGRAEPRDLVVRWAEDEPEDSAEEQDPTDEAASAGEAGDPGE